MLLLNTRKVTLRLSILGGGEGGDFLKTKILNQTFRNYMTDIPIYKNSDLILTIEEFQDLHSLKTSVYTSVKLA